MAKRFTELQWESIKGKMKTAASFGAPVRRDGSVVIGTFNIRKLGAIKSRSKQAWDFLVSTCSRFDLLAVQEVQDDMEGLRELKRRLGDKFGLVVSDTTGKLPGGKGMAERLAFLFQWEKIERTELASDISYDRTEVSDTLFTNREGMRVSWDDHLEKLGKWTSKVEVAKAEKKKSPSKPPLKLPVFVTFIRQPLCASFRIKPAKGSGADPIELLAVNAHLLYGEDPEERRWEFEALLRWLAARAKQKDRTYHDNILLLGDCNLEFETAEIKRDEIDAQLKDLNDTVLKSKRAAKVNFPLLSPHPDHGLITTNARGNQTYDQIALFAHDERLPTYKANETAGKAGANGYDYGAFRFTDLAAAALHDVKTLDDATPAQQKRILDRVKDDLSDHLPAWFRLPIPS
jgi:endonuclease/exonuclease/phosphatase family metal-dependent hydrolase